MKNKYERNQQILLILQGFLIIFGLTNTLFQLCTNTGSTSEGMLNGLVYLAVIALYVFVLVYAFWGYRKSVVPFQLAIAAYMLVAGMTMTANIAATETPESVMLRVFAEVVLIALSFVFLAIAKKHKKPAIIVGAVLVLIELLITIFGCIAAFAQGGFITVAAQQPFAGFIAMGAIFITYCLRTHWSNNGKIGTLEE